MACRLFNLHTQPLRVDLRGGEVLVLPPGTRSAALREESLYDNPNVPEWERAGWLRREPARLGEVGAAPAAAAPARKDEAAGAPGAAKSAAPKPLATASGRPARKRSAPSRTA